MVAPPTGTITFLFTDIEGSSRMWEKSPQTMRSALARHDEILQSAIGAHGGYVFKTVGDAFCAAFPTAPEALEVAVSAQRALFAEEWPKEVGQLRVRMALHTGAAEARGGDYFGPPLNRVARLLSAAQGGQVLFSVATQELVRDQLPTGADLRDLGEHRLKDLIRPEWLFQLIAQGLPAEFPPLRTLEGHPNNLPLQATPLVGREREVDEVRRRLLRPEVRLLTLSGPGGIGKTRLALQAAAELLDEFQDGVFFVQLATVTDPQLVVSAVMGTLGVRETGDLSLVETLKRYLRDKQMLLVLDNFEQVLAAAPMVTELLEAPRLKALTTSRTALRLYGEQEYAVPPLAVPDTVRLPELEALSHYEAVKLFIERAQAARADFSITNENAPAVAEICARLDGLPLAIELAAARIKLLPPRAMLGRLGRRLKLLSGGARDLPERQRTLRGAIEWSHTLLDEGEKTLFARMAIFSGGRTLEAIEAVCDAEGDLPVDAFEGVSSLLDKSLLTQEEGPEDEPRFVMLETIHEFAREKLQESGEAEEIGRAHTRYFLALAEEAEPELTGAEQVPWMDRLEAEHDNLRAALSRSLEAGDAESALRIGGAVWRFWNVRGYLSEGRRWLESGLSVGEASPVGVRARASLGLGYLALMQGAYTHAAESLQGSLSLYREAKDRRGEAYALCFLGWIAADRYELDRAEGLLEESLALSRVAGTARDVSVALNALAMLEVYRGEYERARAMQEECLRLAREAGDVQIIAVLTYNLGLTAAMTGEYERAKAAYEEAQELFCEVGDRDMAALANSRLGFLALSRDDPDQAEELCVEAIRELHERARIPGLDFALDVLAGVAAARGEIRRAARLWGAAAAFRGVNNIPWLAEEREMIEPHIEAARTRLEEAIWHEEWKQGRAMSLDQAVGYALEASGERTTEQG
jgi:predicted ATPase/class 3 adenylate cyclase